MTANIFLVSTSVCLEATERSLTNCSFLWTGKKHSRNSVALWTGDLTAPCSVINLSWPNCYDLMYPELSLFMPDNILIFNNALGAYIQRDLSFVISGSLILQVSPDLSEPLSVPVFLCFWVDRFSRRTSFQRKPLLHREFFSSCLLFLFSCRHSFPLYPVTRLLPCQG